MKTSSALFKLLLASALASVLAACGNNTTPSSSETSSKAVPVVTSTLAVDAYSPPVSTTAEPSSPLKPRDLKVAPVATNIPMGAPSASQADALKANNSASATTGIDGGKPLQIGFGRDVAQTSTATGTNQLLKWQATANGGNIAALNFTSTGAKGMRVGLLVTKLPDSATLRFYAKGDAKAFEIKGADVNAILLRNLDAGDKTDAGRTYVGPMTTGADSTVEIELPAGVATSSVDVAIPTVSHMVMTANEAAYASQTAYSWSNDALTCQVDVSCRATLPAASNAVAWLIFQKAGGNYICSGTLLNDSIFSAKPYLLTANHCISDQTAASTLQPVFQYKSASCNATNGNYFLASTNSSTLLYTAYNTDSTLLLLAGTPPAGSLFAGWDASVAPVASTAIHTVAHPQGDAQRYTAGSVTVNNPAAFTYTYYTRNPTNPNSFPASDITNGTIVSVTTTTGLTEGGSSGSGLFKGAETPNPQVIGQLYGGYTPSCTMPGGTVATPNQNVYGRFDKAFYSGMSDWLAPASVKLVTQFYNASTGVYYYTSGLTDTNGFTSSNPGYNSQGPLFKVSTVQLAGLSPVYRFYDTVNGSYFYTISEKERAAVATNTPRMRFDGIVWYASAAAAAGKVPLYRAFNSVTGSQFLTTNSTARSNLINNNPQFKTDGIAFYVTP